MPTSPKITPIAVKAAFLKTHKAMPALRQFITQIFLTILYFILIFSGYEWQKP